MEATQFLLESTQCLPGAEEISAKIMGGDGGDDEESDGVEFVEVEAVAAVSRDDESEDNQAANANNAKKEPVTMVRSASSKNDDGVSSGKVLELPKSMVDDTKKEKGSPSPESSSSSSPVTPRKSVEVSATTPRGKFDLTLHESTGIVLRNKKEEVVAVPSSSVATVIVFPKAEDCRRATSNGRKKGPPKRPGNLVLLVLKKEEADGVQFRGKSLKQICFQLPQSILPQSSPSDGEESDDGGGMMVLEPVRERDIELEWVDLLGKTFGVQPEKVVLVSNSAYLTDDGREERAYAGRYNFKSDETEGTSTTTAGMPYVKCYEGVNDGVLFPLEEGLLFFKPPKFVPRSTLHSIQCGRGGGDSRYVDLVAELEDDEGAVEFSNIAREEVRVLNDFIHQVLIKAMTRDAEGGEAEGDEKVAAAAIAASPAAKIDEAERKIGSSANESPIGTSSGDDSIEFVGTTGGRARRAASRDAREATKAQLQANASGGGNDEEDSDDDDEEDFVMDANDSASESEDDSEEDESDASEDEEEGGDATESEDDNEEEEPMKKKAKML